MSKKIRFGFDVGSNSIGWSVLEGNKDGDKPTEMCKLIHAGVRIYPNSRDAKTYGTLSSERTMARSARRRHDRYKQRRKRLVHNLIKYRFWDEKKAKGNVYCDPTKGEVVDTPYVLRGKVLDESVSPAEFGRILFHINQRRGFKSNRISGDSSEKGVIQPVIKKIRENMQSMDARTIGEFLSKRYERGEYVRARNISSTSRAQYELYFDRSMYEEEFNSIWDVQKKISLHKRLYTDEARESLRSSIFFQRKLKSQKDAVGGCALEEEEKRARKALPSSQLLRIYQDVCHITYGEVQGRRGETHEINTEQRDALVTWLCSRSSAASPSDVIKQLKKISDISGDVVMNFERAENKNFKSASTHVILSEIVETWNKWDIKKQDEFVLMIFDPEKDDEEVVQELEEKFSISKIEAEKSIQVVGKLEPSYGNLSKVAIYKLLEVYKKDEILTYDKAVRCAGYEDHRMQLRTGYKTLPYYGEILHQYTASSTGELNDPPEKRYGRIGNPTVHVGLNQMRHVVNELIRRYGKPDEIVVELLRELPCGTKQYNENNKYMRERKKKNDEIRADLEEKLHYSKISREDIEKYRLWEELAKDPCARKCPYTGKNIGIFDLANATEIDHILPRSRTLDNSFSNKILCSMGANREKGEKTPFEAWGHTEKWDGIYARACLLPGNKKWRFNKDAMKRFQEDGDFIDYQLNSSQYLAKVMQYYLASLKEEGHNLDIWVTPGKLTNWLSHDWGLPSLLVNDPELKKRKVKKNRNDYRNHAIDAIVVACTGRSILQKIAKKLKRSEEGKRKDEGKRSIAPVPWEGFRRDVETVMNAIVVSFKNDRSKEGRLLCDTAYTLPKQFEISDSYMTKEPMTVSSKVDIMVIQKKNLKRGGGGGKTVASEKTRKLLSSYFDRYSKEKEAMEQCKKDHAIRHVKCIETLTLIPIKDKAGNYYKGYQSAGNWAVEIYEDEKEKWQDEIITRYAAHQRGFIPLWRKKYPTKPMIMRLHINDMLIMNNPREKNSTEKVILRVCKLSKGEITMSEHNEANVSNRSRDKKETFEYIRKSAAVIQKLDAKKIHVSPTGLYHR